MSATQSEAKLRAELVRYSSQMHHAGWVANHDGNLSARVGDEPRFVCTPTSWSKLDVSLDDLLVVNERGERIAGKTRPFSELNLHMAVYRLRADVKAVVHAHPPSASAYGVAGRPLPHPFFPEAVVSLGAHIPLVPVSAPGQGALEALAPWVRRCDAVMIAGNGVLAWGPSLELAYLRLELIEHLATIAYRAEPLGGAQRLPDEMISALVQKRAKAGLCAPEEEGAEARGADPIVEAVTERLKRTFPRASQGELAKLTREALSRRQT